MPAPAIAGAALSGEAGDIAGAASEAAAESKGLNIAFVIAALAVAYFVFQATNQGVETAEDVREGAGDVGAAVGVTAGDAYRGTQDVTSETVEGTQDVVGDALDWGLGGGADTVENIGREAGEGYEFVAGGSQDVIRDAGGVFGGLIE